MHPDKSVNYEYWKWTAKEIFVPRVKETHALAAEISKPGFAASKFGF